MGLPFSGIAMCDRKCSEQLQKAYDDAVAQRNEAYKVYRQWEGAVLMIEKLIALFAPKDV